MASREIDAISIGISANTGALRTSLAKAQATINEWVPKGKTVYIDVVPRFAMTRTGARRLRGDEDAKVAVGKQADIIANTMRAQVVSLQKRLDKTLEFRAIFKPTKATLQELVTGTQKTLDEWAQQTQGSRKATVTVNVKPNLASAEAFHGSLQKAIDATGPILVPIQWVAPKEPPMPPSGKGAKPGKGPKGGGGGTPAPEPEEKPQGPLTGTVSRPVRARAQTHPETQRAAGLSAAVPTKAPRPAASPTPTKVTQLPDANFASIFPQAGSFASELTPEKIFEAQKAGKVAEMAKHGLVVNTGTGTFKLTRAGKTQANQDWIRENVLGVLAGNRPGRRVGSEGGGKGSRFFTGGQTGGAMRLAAANRDEESTRMVPRPGGGWLAQPHDPNEILNRLIGKGNLERFEAAQKAAQGPIDPAYAAQFKAAAVYAQPYLDVLSTLEQKKTLNLQDRTDLNNLLRGKPEKIKLTNPVTSIPFGQEIAAMHETAREFWPGFSEMLGKDSKKPLPIITPQGLTGRERGKARPGLLNLIATAHPSQYFGSVGATKGIEYQNPETGEVTTRAPGSTLALAGALRGVLGTESAGTGIRGLLTRTNANEEREQRARVNRKQTADWKKLQAQPDEPSQLALLSKIKPDINVTPAYLRQVLSPRNAQGTGGWGPSSFGKKAPEEMTETTPERAEKLAEISAQREADNQSIADQLRDMDPVAQRKFAQGMGIAPEPFGGSNVERFIANHLKNYPRRALGGKAGKWPRVYRGDTRHAGDKAAPSWLLEHPHVQDSIAAHGRWFTGSPEMARTYVNDFGDGTGDVTSVALGPRQYEKYRVSNFPETKPLAERSLLDALRGGFDIPERRGDDPRRFSADPENEWFLPRKIADRAKPHRALGGRTGPADPDTFGRITKLKPRAYDRAIRRMRVENDLMDQGLDPNSPTRKDASRLANQADALVDRLGEAGNKAYRGYALGGEIEGPLTRRLREAREGKTPSIPNPVEKPVEPAKPFVPEWRRRGMAKDITGYALGGPMGRLQRALPNADLHDLWVHPDFLGELSDTAEEASRMFPITARSVRSLSSSLDLQTHKIGEGNTTHGRTRAMWRGERMIDSLAKELGPTLALTLPTAALPVYARQKRWEDPQSSITLNGRMTMNPDRAAAGVAYGESLGHWPTGSSAYPVGGTLAHEMGHALDIQHWFAPSSMTAGLDPISKYGATDPHESLAEFVKAHILSMGTDEERARLGTQLTTLSNKERAQARSQYALGGGTPKQPYIVGEAGPEIFVPESAGWIIPHQLMDQLPKRAEGGSVKGDHDVIGGPYPTKGKRGSYGAGDRALFAGSINMGQVNRVFVTNWPTSLFGGGQAGGSGGGGFVASASQPLNQHEKISIKTAAQANAAENEKVSKKKSAAGETGAKTKTTYAPGSPEAIESAEDKERKRRARFMKPMLPEDLTPLEDAQLKAKSLAERYSPGSVRDIVSMSTERIKVGLQSMPMRSPTTGTGQIAALGVRTGVQERARQVKLQEQYVSHLGSLKETAEEELRKSLLKRDKASVAGRPADEVDALEKRSESLRQVVGFLDETLEPANKRLAEASKNVATFGDKAKSAAANIVGVATGTVGFMAAMTVVNTGLQLGGEALSKALGPAIERGTGYLTITNETVNALGDETKAMRGFSQTAVATAAANAGLGKSTYDLLAPTLQVAANVNAGNKALSAQIDLVNTSQQIQSQYALTAAGLPMGPLQPAGGIPGITRATGGLLNSPLGATPSLWEQLAQEGSVSGGQQFGKSAISALAAPPQMLLDTLGAPMNAIAGAIGAPKPSDVFRQGITGVQAGLGLDQVKSPMAVLGEQGHVSEEQFTHDLNRTGGLINTFNTLNDDAKKAGSSLKLMPSVNAADLEQGRQALAAIPGMDPATAQLVKDMGMVLRDTKTFKVATGDQARQFSESAATGASKVDAAVMIQQMTSTVIPAAIRDINRQTQYALQVQQPAEFALGRIAQPVVPFAQDPRLKASQQLLGGKGMGPLFAQDQQAAQGFADKYKTLMVGPNGAETIINAQFDKGRQLLSQMGVSDKQIGQLQTLGSEITQINTGLQQKQTNLAVADYTNQIRIANRSLGDARDMWAGIHGNVRQTLGGLEGQNVALSRQLQLLGFMLQQRQINFSVATAGFVAPGQTPEEIAARIKEAKIEADYAQKQLNLQKQIGSNQYKVTGIGAGRSIQDAMATRDLAVAGRALVQETSAAQAAIERLTAARDILLNQAQTVLGAQISQDQILLGTLKQIETETGTLLDDQVKAISGAWGKATVSYKTDFLDPVAAELKTIFGYLGAGTADATPGSTQYGSTYHAHAGGYVGTVSSATQMTVGEAGTETVAVLRNPRAMAIGSSVAGGGGSPVYIIFNHPVVKDETDIDLLVRKVKGALQRDTAMYGLRRP